MEPLRWQPIDPLFLGIAQGWEDGYFHTGAWWYAKADFSEERGPFQTLKLARAAYHEWRLTETGEDDRGTA